MVAEDGFGCYFPRRVFYAVWIWNRRFLIRAMMPPITVAAITMACGNCNPCVLLAIAALPVAYPT